MFKLKNSLQIKKFLRIALIVVIIIQLILVTVQLYEYFNKLVIVGISTNTASTEQNYFIRFLNFFEIGVGALIKENILNICLPLLVYVLLRDRDREILYGNELTEAIKEGVIEGVDEVTSPTHKKTYNEKINQKSNNEKLESFKSDLKAIDDTKSVETKDITTQKKEPADLNNLDDFFSKLK